MVEIDKSISFDGRDIRLKIGLLAPQAGGAVLIQSGDTAVLVTATRSQGREGIDFLPLLVDYEERLYAGGKIPGGFLRREGVPRKSDFDWPFDRSTAAPAISKLAAR
jgi:Polyribonucleotide nucleotidyltransferase (polynucleotide phosphorylase)